MYVVGIAHVTADMDGRELFGRRVRVEFSKPLRNEAAAFGGRSGPPSRGPPSRTNYRVVVTNLPGDTSWQDLKVRCSLHGGRNPDPTYYFISSTPCEWHLAYRMRKLIPFVARRVAACMPQCSLQDFGRAAGQVLYTAVKPDAAPKDHLKVGVIEFAQEDDMRYALRKLDGTTIRGERVRLDPETPDRNFRNMGATEGSYDTRGRGAGGAGGGGGGGGGGDGGGRGRSRSRERSRSRSRSRSGERRRGGDRDRSRSASRSPPREHEPSHEAAGNGGEAAAPAADGGAVSGGAGGATDGFEA